MLTSMQKYSAVHAIAFLIQEDVTKHRIPITREQARRLEAVMRSLHPAVHLEDDQVMEHMIDLAETIAAL